jgi:hypothetical protein
MGHLHLIRSGGIGGTGKTLVASMLFEFCRSRKAPCHFIDAQRSPEMGLKYSPELNSGKDHTYFDPEEPTKADRLIELAKDSEVIVDIPTGHDYLASQWIAGVNGLIRKQTLSIVDWFINNQTPASWQASQRHAKFWQELQTIPTQIFVMNGHFATTPGAFPADAKQQCWENSVGMMFFPAPAGVILPTNQLIGEVIAQSVYPNAQPLKQWRDLVFDKFRLAALIPEPPALDFSGAHSLKDLIKIVTSESPRVPTVTEIEDAPW